MPTLLQVMNGAGDLTKTELVRGQGSTAPVPASMVEQTSGLAPAQYMDKEVIAPLGMKSNSYALSPDFEPAAGVDRLNRDDEPQVGLSTGHDMARHRASPALSSRPIS
ncbi:hypothetical protein AB0K16_42490 [Nonomuraea jabiensis]|uniref:hypothetical protein n=1 Tax=Nonomuraea jabiensis TaxID=882448 RepID=UPI0034389101